MTERNTPHDDVVHDERINGAVDYAARCEQIESITGIKTSNLRTERTHAWTDGFEHGVEYAGKGELLDECTDLHYQMFDLDMEQKNLLAFSEFALSIREELITHTVDCECVFCKALRTLDEKRICEDE
jgi:hypothetical protein